MKKFYILFFLTCNTIFGESLIDICQHALANDPTYLAAKAEWMIAQQDIPLAQADLLPNLDFVWDGSLSSIHPRGTPSASGSNNSFFLHLSQPVFDARAIVALSKSKINVRAARANLIAATQATLVRAASQYFKVITAKESLETFISQRKTAKKEYLLAKLQFKAGTKSKLNLYEAKANYDNTVANTIDAENNLLIAQQNLEMITNKQYKKLDSINKAMPLSSINRAQKNRWIELAKDQNYELRSARLAYLAAQEGVEVARLERVPVVNMVGTVSREKTNAYGPPGFFELHFKTFSIGLDISAPVYDGGKISANTDKAKANVLLSRANKELKERQIMTDVKNNFQNILADIKTIKARKTAETSAQIDLDETLIAYKQGIRTLNDVSITMTALQKAQENFIYAKYNYLNNILLLKNSTGMLSYDDIINISKWLTKPININ